MTELRHDGESDYDALVRVTAERDEATKARDLLAAEHVALHEAVAAAKAHGDATATHYQQQRDAEYHERLRAHRERDEFMARERREQARLINERDAARVEAEELRAALHALIALIDHLLHGTNEPTPERVSSAHALISRPPTVAAFRAREALAALAWAENIERDYQVGGATDYSYREPTTTARREYLVARADREAAESVHEVPSLK